MRRTAHAGFLLPETALLDAGPKGPPSQSSNINCDEVAWSPKMEFASEAEWRTFDAQQPPFETITQETRQVAATHRIVSESKPQRLCRLFIAGTGSPYDAIKRDHLMQDEAASLGAAANAVKLHGAGGIIEPGQVATAHLKPCTKPCTRGCWMNALTHCL